jgi:hypothetical protein
LARKRTKAEALERLAEARAMAPKGVKGKARTVLDVATIGAAGLIMLDPFNRLADERIVLPLDMVCIPAYQAYMIQGSPSMQIYVRAGETIIPTGGNVRDVEEALIDPVGRSVAADVVERGTKKRKVMSSYQRKYKAAFAKVAPKYKLKNGKWKKGGFKAAVKAAHKKVGSGK